MDLEYHAFRRVGTEKPRAYYVPFSLGQTATEKHGIIDREQSDRFIALNGEWQIKEHKRLADADVNELLTEKITVPSCVQMKGYDQIQYLNFRYPIPFDPPFVPEENPTYHYRRTVNLPEIAEKYYLVFEGVDSGFYLFVNGQEVGYGQISHATNEFDVTPFLKEGENTVDVFVLKWCASTYLECQDKMRFTGIFRSVYLLRRPQEHITDYKITGDYDGKNGTIEIFN